MRARPWGLAAIVAAAAGAGVWVDASWPDDAPAARTAPPAGSPGYERSAFGDGWADADGDGCDTRAEVLQRWMRAERVRDANGGGCLVLSGRLTDPYTRVTAVVDASSVDIDHVVALADAWRSGADGWTTARREQFANDPANLRPTAASVNRSKSDLGPDKWSPSSRLGACAYLRTYQEVKVTYDLDVTASQRAALDEGLAGCPA